MAAIITSKFRVDNASRLLTDVNLSNYYLAIGKSDPWPVTSSVEIAPLPSTAGTELDIARKNFIAMKKIVAGASDTAAEIVIPRVNWTAGSRYKVYDRSDASCLYQNTVGSIVYNPAYCYYSGSIYVCTRAGAGSSDYAPNITASTVGAITLTTDGSGYSWALVGTVVTTSKLFLREFIPLPTGGASTGGEIYGYIGATPSGTDVIRGDGTGAGINGLDGSISAKGSGYKYAAVYTSGGTYRSDVRLLISPASGFGADPSAVLPAWFLGLGADFNDTESGELPTSNDYRQISIIKNASVNTPGGLVRALKGLNVGTVSPGVTADMVITQPSTGAKGWVSHVTTSGPNYIIWYHQNDASSVNTVPFTAGSPITFAGAGSPTANVTLVSPEYDADTGDIIFLENRTRVTRASSQVEEVRVIIQF